MTSINTLAQLLSQVTTAPAAEGAEEVLPPAVMAILAGLVAVEALGLWLLTALGAVRRDRLLLRQAPARPNRLHLLLALGLIVLQFILEGGAGLLLAPPAPGVPAEPTRLTEMHLVAMWIGRLLTLGVALWLARRTFAMGIGVGGLGLTSRRLGSDTLRGLGGLLAVYPVVLLLIVIAVRFVPLEHQGQHPVLEFVTTPGRGVGWQVLAVLTAVGLAPLLEELIFRGLLQSALRGPLGGPWGAILGAAAIFAGLHITAGLGNLHAIVPLGALAIGLGYLYERTGRLWPSIVMHAAFNAISLAATYAEAARAA